MEIHSFDQVSHRFWLESSQMWITNFPETITRLNRLHDKKVSKVVSRVSIKVSTVDGFDQLFRHLDDFLSSQPDAIVFVNVVS